MLRIDVGAFSSDWPVSVDDVKVGMIDRSHWRERCVFTAGNETWFFRKQGWQQIVVEQPEGLVIASAAPASVWGGRWSASTSHGSFVLRKPVFASHVTVVGGDVELGTVEQGAFRQTCRAYLPDSIPLWVQTFLAWVVISWRRRASAAAGAAASS